MLRSFFVLLLFQALGEAVKAATGVLLPGPIIGMLMLFAALCAWQKLPQDLIATSQQLISHLPLMILPPAVGVYFLGRLFSDQWLAISAAVLVGTILSFVFNALLLKRLVKK